jgi:hypothetical protein
MLLVLVSPLAGDDFRVFCGMMDGLAFLPVPDLNNGIHLLRTLQVVETALVVDVATKYSCNCTKDCIFKVWTLNCRLLAWQLTTTNSSCNTTMARMQKTEY